MSRTMLAAALVWMLAWSGTAWGANGQGAGTAAIETADAAMRQAEQTLRTNAKAMALLESVSVSAETTAAMEAVTAAEGALEAAIAAAPGLAESRAKLRAAQEARDGAVSKAMEMDPTWKAATQRLAELDQRIAQGSAGLAKQGIAEAMTLATLARERDELSRRLSGAARAMWTQGEAAAAYSRADVQYKDYHAKLGRDAGAKQAGAALSEAKKRLEQARETAAAASELGVKLTQERARLEQAVTVAKTARDAAVKAVVGDKQWTCEVKVELPPRKGKPRDPSSAMLWIPPGVKTVRGLVIGHPPVLGGSLTTDARIRAAAADEALGVVLLKELDGVFTVESDSPQRFEQVLRDLAAGSKHPEVERVPWLTIGHSTSGIFARNVAYWRPNRVMGVVHIKSGNMHQHIPQQHRSLAGVPLLAINGEFEEFGPEGGIRPEYGAQTQWIMIREQLLRWRAQNPAHLVSLIVDPGGSHTSWSSDLSRVVALFIRKAAQRRLPATMPAEGAVECVTLRPEDGWLTDGLLKSPASATAAWAAYRGDRAKAFWHLDQEMAEAVDGVHRGAFVLPDLGVASPVPATWPGK